VAPPTFDTIAIPKDFSSAPLSSPSTISSFSTAARMPRSTFVPWSPSPVAVGLTQVAQGGRADGGMVDDDD
jgi:hypothetical protein